MGTCHDSTVTASWLASAPVASPLNTSFSRTKPMVWRDLQTACASTPESRASWHAIFTGGTSPWPSERIAPRYLASEPPRSEAPAGRIRPPGVPVGHALVGAGDAEHRRVVVGAADDLNRQRQAVASEAARHHARGQAKQVPWRRVARRRPDHPDHRHVLEPRRGRGLARENQRIHAAEQRIHLAPQTLADPLGAQI